MSDLQVLLVVEFKCLNDRILLLLPSSYWGSHGASDVRVFREILHGNWITPEGWGAATSSSSRDGGDCTGQLLYHFVMVIMGQ